MNDFKSYSGETPEKNTNTNAGDVNSTVEMAKMMSKAMSGKSERQIFQTIMQEAERGKRDGTLSNTDLDNFYNALSPMLDGMKRRKLKEIITKLKSI